MNASRVALHFTYSDGPLSRELLQGDILQRTPAIEAILEQVHPHYSRPDNKYFLILSQSCDLVLRDGQSKARYISIAPVRPLAAVVERYMDTQRRSDLPRSLPVFTADAEGRIRQSLVKLFNNNDTSYFFLRKEVARNFPEDCCAFLGLSISLKADLHYKTCVAAKLLELQDVFRAKLGWLVGNMYSRVGTKDWDQGDLDTQLSSLLQQVSLWIPKNRYKEVRAKVREWKAANGGADPPLEVLAKIVEALPKKEDRLVERLLKILTDQGLVANAEVATNLGNTLRNDTVLLSMISE